MKSGEETGLHAITLQMSKRDTSHTVTQELTTAEWHLIGKGTFDLCSIMAVQIVHLTKGLNCL